MKKEFVCIVCPQSCNLEVWQDEKGEIQVKGNKCPRGLEFGKQEFVEPIRTLTTTMKIKGAFYPVIPVRTNKGIPYEKIQGAMKQINNREIEVPVKAGQVLIKDIAGVEGVDVVAQRAVDNKMMSDE